MITHYDSIGRQEIRIQEVMEDLKDHLQAMDRRMQVIHFTTIYTGAVSGLAPGANLA